MIPPLIERKDMYASMPCTCEVWITAILVSYVRFELQPFWYRMWGLNHSHFGIVCEVWITAILVLCVRFESQPFWYRMWGLNHSHFGMVCEVWITAILVSYTVSCVSPWQRHKQNVIPELGFTANYHGVTPFLFGGGEGEGMFSHTVMWKSVQNFILNTVVLKFMMNSKVVTEYCSFGMQHQESFYFISF